MAAYPSWKKGVKNEKQKKLPKLDIFSAMAVMENISNIYSNNQDKPEVKKITINRTKRKEKQE
jgi:hypothetical protein